MKFIGIIPARYQSTRFPGKPLAMINDKPMIQWVYENVKNAIAGVWVATDDDRISDAVKNFGGEVVKTSSMHKSGTDRCAEAARILEKETDFDAIINIQGDEPFVHPNQIELLKSCFEKETQIATLIKKIVTADELFNVNRPKVVLDKQKNAMYFSRSPIPFVRGEEESYWLKVNTFWAHIGMYAYRTDILQEITGLEPSKLEIAESLEQLRWIENGIKIKTSVTEHQSIGIDTPDDLQVAVDFLNKKFE